MVVVAVAIVWALATCSRSPSSSNDAASVATSSPSATSAAQGRQYDEQQFLASADKSISGPMIARDKSKYVGDSVAIACTVASIIDENSFNAQCAQRGDPVPAIILVDYDDTVSLNKGQAVRIMGTVEEPAQGLDASGKQATFAAVKAQFIE
jgi:hypothetical protein